MDPTELDKWFASTRSELENAYLATDTPWQQSGFAGPEERWDAVRRPIADCVVSDGTFLDIGCANGYLLECLMRWTSERGITIDPWGLDISEKLVELAKKRLPSYATQIHVGNALFWNPQRRFDYVYTLLDCIPEEYIGQYISRLLDEFLTEDGTLLVGEYRSRNDPVDAPWFKCITDSDKFTIYVLSHGFWDGIEHTRIAAVNNRG